IDDQREEDGQPQQQGKAKQRRAEQLLPPARPRLQPGPQLPRIGQTQAAEVAALYRPDRRPAAQSVPQQQQGDGQQRPAEPAPPQPARPAAHPAGSQQKRREKQRLIHHQQRQPEEQAAQQGVAPPGGGPRGHEQGRRQQRGQQRVGERRGAELHREGRSGDEQRGGERRQPGAVKLPRKARRKRNEQQRGDEVGQAGNPGSRRADQRVKERLQVEEQRRLIDELRGQQRVAPDGDEARPGGKKGLVAVEGVGEKR